MCTELSREVHWLSELQYESEALAYSLNRCKDSAVDKGKSLETVECSNLYALLWYNYPIILVYKRGQV